MIYLELILKNAMSIINYITIITSIVGNSQHVAVPEQETVIV